MKILTVNYNKTDLIFSDFHIDICTIKVSIGIIVTTKEFVIE